MPWATPSRSSSGPTPRGPRRGPRSILPVRPSASRCSSPGAVRGHARPAVQRAVRAGGSAGGRAGRGDCQCGVRGALVPGRPAVGAVASRCSAGGTGVGARPADVRGAGDVGLPQRGQLPGRRARGLPPRARPAGGSRRPRGRATRQKRIVRRSCGGWPRERWASGRAWWASACSWDSRRPATRCCAVATGGPWYPSASPRVTFLSLALREGGPGAMARLLAHPDQPLPARRRPPHACPRMPCSGGGCGWRVSRGPPTTMTRRAWRSPRSDGRRCSSAWP